MLYNDIERELSQLDPFSFEKLVVTLLDFEGYHIISALGTVIGENKAIQGQPDSIFEYKENIIFCEKTTRKTDLLNKLKEDIKHCFCDAQLNKEDISKIILAFNGRITGTQYNELMNYKNLFNSKTELKIYGLDKLCRLAFMYPNIGIHLPNIKISPYLLTLNDFISKTGSPFQPTLLNPYLDLHDFEKINMDKDMLIIKGKSGVGKTRLAIELSNYLRLNEDYKVLCVTYFEDNIVEFIRQYINPKYKYVLFFDDITSNFDIFEKIQKSSIDLNKIKIIVTVRDVFNVELLKDIPTYNAEIISLNDFNFENLSKLWDLNFEEKNIKSLKNETYKNYLIKMSNNNPRILMMIIELIKNNNNQIPNNLEEVYEQYFKKINSFKLLDDNDIKLLSIVSIFKSFNLEEEMMKNYLKIFNIDYSSTVLNKLQELELVDCFNKSFIVNDQVLSNYCQYIVFFKDKLLPFNQLVSNLIEENFIEIKEMVYRLFNIFAEKIEINNLLDSDLSLFEEKHGFKFYDVFWYFYQNDTLIYLNDYIKRIPENQNIIFDISKDKDQFFHNKLINLISNFYSKKNLRKALELGFKLVYKKPELAQGFADSLMETFGYQMNDNNNYESKLDFIELITSKEFKNYDKLREKIILTKFTEYFNLRFSFHDSHGKIVTLYHGEFNYNTSHLDFRKQILSLILNFKEKYPIEVNDSLIEYIQYTTNKDYLQEEKELLLKSFIKDFSVNNTSDILVINYFLNLFEKYHISYDLTKFTDSLCYKILNTFYIINGFYHVKELETEFKTKIFNHMSNKEMSFELTSSILNELNNDKLIKNYTDYNKYIVDYLLQNDEYLFKFFIDYFENKYNYLDFYYKNEEVIEILLTKTSIDELYYIMENNSCSYYMLSLLSNIKSSKITKEHFKWLKKFINNIDYGYYDFEKLYNFNDYYLSNRTDKIAFSNIIVYIFDLIYSKNRSIVLFNFFEKYLEYFTNDLDILKEMFFIYEQEEDISSNELEIMFNLDKNFLIEYLDYHIENNKSKNYEGYDFLWKTENNFKHINKILSHIINNYELLYLASSIDIFKSKKYGKNICKFFENYLNENINDKNRIIITMNIIHQEQGDERFLHFIKKLLSWNCEEEIMQEIEYHKTYSVSYNFSSFELQQLDLLENIEKIIEKDYLFEYGNYYKHIKTLITDTKESYESTKLLDNYQDKILN